MRRRVWFDEGRHRGPFDDRGRRHRHQPIPVRVEEGEIGVARFERGAARRPHLRVSVHQVPFARDEPHHEVAVVVEQLGDARGSHDAIGDEIVEDLADRDGAMERTGVLRGAHELLEEAIEGIHGGCPGHEG
jgi:hypothetical protein